MISGYKVKDKFDAVGLTPIDGRKTPVKVVKEALAVLECKVRRFIKVGDHDLIIGDVLYAYTSGNFDTYWDLMNYNPIL